MNRGFQIRRRLSPATIAVSALLWLVVAMIPAVAMADEGPTQEDGLMALRAANDAFDDEDYDEAYDQYIVAHNILEEPMIMYRMGLSAEKLGLVEAAIDHYQAYREIGDDEVLLERIDEAMPRLRAELPATIEVVSEPSGAEVYSLGAETEELVGSTPAELKLGPGEVELALRLEGYREVTWSQNLEAGGSYEWEAELEEGDEPVAQDGPSGLDFDRVGVDDEPEDSGLAVWGWTSAGIGLGVLALGGAMSFLQFSTTEEINEFDRAAEGEGASQEELNAMRAELATKRQDAENYHRAALGSYLVGGVLTAAGVGILVFDAVRGGDDGGISFEGGFGPDGGFVGVRGRF